MSRLTETDRDELAEMVGLLHTHRDRLIAATRADARAALECVDRVIVAARTLLAAKD